MTRTGAGLAERLAGNAPGSSGANGFPAHWLVFLVNSWTVSQPSRTAAVSALIDAAGDGQVRPERRAGHCWPHGK